MKRFSNKINNGGSTVQLSVENLEGRIVPATIGVAKTVVLDFDGASLNSTELDTGGWGGYENLNFSSFSSLFTNNRPWLDFDGNGQVTSYDANLAINRITEMVAEDFNPYLLNVITGDFESNEFRLTDSIVGDAIVVISGGSSILNNTPDAWGVAPFDAGNNDDEIVFAFGGEIDQAFDPWENDPLRGDALLNSVAQTVSHELGHAFGLKHQTAAPSHLADARSHSIMIASDQNSDWDFERDFVFVDKSFTTEDGGAQNAHRELLKDNVLGRSNRTGLAVHKPGELTIYGNSTNNVIIITELSEDVWNITVSGGGSYFTQDVTLDSMDINSLNPFDRRIGRIVVLAEGGNDYFYVASTFAAKLTVYGGAGDDTIYAGSGNDNLYGGSGYDRIFGKGGNDFLDGGQDGIADYLDGGSGFNRYQQELMLVWDLVNRQWTLINIDQPVNSGFGKKV